MKTVTRYSRRGHRIGRLTLSVLLLALVSCADGPQPNSETKVDYNNLSTKDANKLLIVDCLLPGQTRQLGQNINFMSARRPIKTTAADCQIRGGEYVSFDRANYSTALKIWLPQAQDGNAEAQAYVGEIYEKGLGIAPDYVLAAAWYRKAADQGLGRAKINLGYLYEKGLGVEKDLTKALSLYREASGLTDKDLNFISSVEIAAHEQQRQQLTQANLEIDALRQKMASTQSALKQVQQQHTADVAAWESEKTQLAQRAKDAESARLQAQLAERQLRIEQQQSQIRDLQSVSQQFQQQLQTLEAGAGKSANNAEPTIQIIDPPLAMTRGTPSISAGYGGKQREIVGRVLAPAGLMTLSVNSRVENADKDGMFRVSVPTGSQETPVKIAAMDKMGRETAFEFVIAPPLATSTDAKPVKFSEPILDKASGIAFGRYFALIIGNNQYQKYPRLQSPVADAKEVAKVLGQKYHFETVLITDADRYGILSALNQLRNGLTQDDNLLIYYAGHGELDRANDRGYWIPVDAEPGNNANWISNVAITDILNTLPARHIMVVADSCYSGSMTNSSVARSDTAMAPDLRVKWLRVMSQVRSRTVLTSGGLQPVLDRGDGAHSVFAQAFLQALQSNRDVLEGFSLYMRISDEVRANAAKFGFDQVPGYAPIRHSGHESGEFFFVPMG